MNPIIILAIIVSICAIPATWFLVLLYGKTKRIAETNYMMEKQQLLYKSQYEIIQKQIEVTRKLRHDIAAHINTIQALSKEEVSVQLEEYCSSLEEKYKAFIRIDYCANPIVDAILYQKMQLCIKSEIKLDLHIENFNMDGMEEVDIVGLLGNILDNAIESCLRIEAPEERYIKVSSRYAKNFLVVVIKNAKAEWQVKDTEYKTVKADKDNHGWGLKIVESIVEKYDGSILYKDEDMHFTTTLSLRC